MRAIHRHLISYRSPGNESEQEPHDSIRFTPGLAPLLGLLAGLGLAGCLQVELNIQMHEDGAATIAERVRFLQPLMELNTHLPSDQQLVRLVARPAIEERMKQMGPGVTLVSHRATTQPDGGYESVAVFKIAEVEDLRLVNPLLARGDPNRLMRLRFSPIYKVVHSFHALGELMLELAPAEPVRRQAPGTQPENPPTPSPLELQALRNLEPMFVDMMEGFQVKVRLVATRPITYGHIRDRQSASKVVELISFTDEDLDMYGTRFIENEELMLSLLRLELDAENIADHVQGSSGNHTLPVFRCRKPYASALFRVPPSQHQFKKYFAGRPKSQGGDQPG